MKYLLLILFLMACTSSKDQAKKHVSKTAECIDSDKDGGMTFCVDGPDLLICNAHECLVYNPHE